jgi:hypothetical protein
MLGLKGIFGREIKEFGRENARIFRVNKNNSRVAPTIQRLRRLVQLGLGARKI